MTEVIASLITGGLALVGVIFSNKATANKIQQEIAVQQAITKTQIEELTREVREHNGFAQRMPVVENKIEGMAKEITRLRHYHEQ